MPVPDPVRAELGVLGTDHPRQFLGEHLAHHTNPAAVENASRPSLIAAATSDIATVASNGRPSPCVGIKGRDLHDRYRLHG